MCFIVLEWRTCIKQRNQRQTLRGWLLQDRYVTVEKMCILTIATLRDVFIKTKTNLNLSFYHSLLATWPRRLYLILCPLIIFREWCTRDLLWLLVVVQLHPTFLPRLITWIMTEAFPGFVRSPPLSCDCTSVLVWVVLGLDLNTPYRQSAVSSQDETGISTAKWLLGKMLGYMLSRKRNFTHGFN